LNGCHLKNGSDRISKIITCLDRGRSIGHHRRDRQAGKADGNGSHERYERFREDMRTLQNPCGLVAALIPSFPGTDTRVGISGSTSYRLASRAAAIHPMVLRHTASETGLPKGAAAPRLWWRRLSMPNSVVIASPMNYINHVVYNNTSHV